MQVYCLHPFTKRQRDELSFQKGEVLDIIQREAEGDWWLAQNVAGHRGLIPINMVEPVRKIVQLPSLSKPVASQSAPAPGALCCGNSLPPVMITIKKDRGMHDEKAGSSSDQRVSKPSKIPTLKRRQVSPSPMAPTHAGELFQFENNISWDGSNPFQPDIGRYELIVVSGCPIAARPWLCVQLLGLDEAIRVVRAYPASANDGWFFEPVTAVEKDIVDEHPEVRWDRDGPSCGKRISHLKQLYLSSIPEYNGPISVPVLYDTKTKTIVSNNSLQMVSIICTQFDPASRREGRISRRGPDRRSIVLDPTGRSGASAHFEYSHMLQTIHDNITMGVYAIYFAKTQVEYEKKVHEFFATLDEFEKRLSHQKFILGDSVTFLDLLLFITLVRMPLVYEKLFKVDFRRVDETTYPHLWRHMKYFCRAAGIAETIEKKAIKMTYYLSKNYNSLLSSLTIPIGPQDGGLPI